MTRPQANLLLLLAGAIWGMGFVAQQTAMDDVGPFVFIAVRFLVATLVVLPFALRESRQIHQRGNNPLRMRDWQHFAVIGIVLFAAIGLQQVGLLTTTVTNSGFLTGLYVVFTPFIAILLFREWPHAVVWPAALCAFSGIFLLSGGKFNGHSIGDLLTVGCAVFTALQVVLIARHVTESARPLALSVVQFSVTAGIAFVVALIYEPIVWSAIKAAGNEILYTGVMSSGVAFTLQANCPALYANSAGSYLYVIGGAICRTVWCGIAGRTHWIVRSVWLRTDIQRNVGRGVCSNAAIASAQVQPRPLVVSLCGRIIRCASSSARTI